MDKERAKIQNKDFEEIELPDTVWKYRDWKDAKHQIILTERKVWFAKPSSFNDPFDCKIPIRYDLMSDWEIFEKYLYESKQKAEHQNWSRQQHRNFAKHWTKKTPLRNKIRIKEFQEQSFKDFDSQFGVLSLTANPTNLQMWKLYSAEHSGFCIGFNPRIMFRYFGGGGKVKYYDELPIIKPIPFHDFETQHIYQAYSKLNKWEYEEEYRVSKIFEPFSSFNKRSMVLHKEAIKEVILGAKMNEQHKSEIISIIKNSLSHVSVSQSILNECGKYYFKNIYQPNSEN